MKKVALITLYRDNFGSILQAYSTYNYINGLGYECEILEQNQAKTILDKIKKVPNFLYKSLRYREFLSDRKKAKECCKEDLSLLSNVTKKKMDAFISSTFNVREVASNRLDDINNDYDLFITGSDQVWNGYIPFRFLTFVDRKKRIAFAPSFGSSIKEYNRDDIRQGLMGFDNLSVREESGVQIIKELTGKVAKRLADPTLLLSKKEWVEFASKGMKKKNYILLHFLNKPNELAIKTINEYLNVHNCMAYSICNNYEIKGWDFIDINPYDYVSLINNADMIFTDSFHSTLFSLNLETQFLTFERQYLHGNSQSSRIVDLLNRVGMKDRFLLDGQNEPSFEDFTVWDSDELFLTERKNIQEYLKNSLNV